VHDFELRAAQRLWISVELWVRLADTTPREDRLAEVVDYDFVRETVAERVGRGRIGLQETLADELLAAMLAHPRVVAARVTTEKPDVYADCESVGVEVSGFGTGA
jgi:dihydroneopterin aldolase